MACETLYRVKNVLSDGRGVYVSKRGMIHLMTRRQAELYQRMREENADPKRDPGVYARDLGMYGNRSLFLDSLSSFVMVAATTIEPETVPVSGEAFILGGVPAITVEAYRDERP
jgi:hypothetical protein